MAEKRFISKRLTESEKFRRLANERCDLACSMYQAHLAHLDRKGRMRVNPVGLSTTIWEGYPYTPAEIESALRDMARVGLVHLYSNGRHSHIVQYTKFLTSEGGFNTPHPKEPESDLPGPFDKGSVILEPGPAGSPVETPGKDAGNVPGKDAGKEPGKLGPVIALHCIAGTDKPPLPPQAPSVEVDSEGEGAELELTPYQRAQAERSTTNHHLPTFHPTAFRELTSFKRLHKAEVRTEQFNVWASGVLDDVRAFGEPRVVEALQATNDNFADLTMPFAYYRARVKREPEPERKAKAWEVDFFAQRKDDLRVEQIDELLAGEQARMSNGEVWDLTECRLCNN